MQALYRKYRPTKLENVIGQPQVTTPLKNAIKAGKISHAYLFTGPRGCGKTSVARIFAHEINHFSYEIEDNYVDIIEIDAASNTGVDNIRELREKAVIAPTEGKYKVYIIDEVHMLTKAAFNALLKTLEEPPKNVIFIMATTDAYKVPVTITSRSQVYNFQLASPDLMLKHLKTITSAEKIAIEDAALELIVQKGGGSFRDSISLLDQISTLSSGTSGNSDSSDQTAVNKTATITKAAVLSALGLPEQEIIDHLLNAYKSGDINDITKTLKNELDSGLKPEILAENLIRAIIKHPEPKLLPLLERLPTVKNPFPEAKILLAFLAEAAEKPVLHLASPNLAPNAPQSNPPLETPPSAPKASFDSASYIENIKTKSSALAKVLENCHLEKSGDTLKIVLKRKSQRVVLRSTNNQKILHEFLPAGSDIEIVEQAPQNLSQFSTVSDIMGAVTEVNPNDGNPFA